MDPLNPSGGAPATRFPSPAGLLEQVAEGVEAAVGEVAEAASDAGQFLRETVGSLPNRPSSLGLGDFGIVPPPHTITGSAPTGPGRPGRPPR